MIGAWQRLADAVDDLVTAVADALVDALLGVVDRIERLL